MDSSGAWFDFPISEEVAMLDSLSDDMRNLREQSEELDDFFDKAIEIDTVMAPLQRKMTAVYRNLSDAVNALHISKLCTDYCMKKSLYVKGKE